MKKLFFFLALILLLALPERGSTQEVARGYFAVNDCGTIFGPTPMRIVCLQLEDHAPSGRTKGNEYQFNASHVWVQYNNTGGGSSAASAITFTPAGNISATNVQAALQELDKEKLAVGGNATTATALAADGTNCTGVQAAQGVDAQGNAQGCFTPAGAGTITGVTAGTGLTGGGASGSVTLNLDVPVTVPRGGTNATTAAGARTNLGLGTMATQDAGAVAITGGSISGITITGNLVGNASTATALAADPANCSAGQSPLGIDSSGTAQGCFDVATQAELDAHTNSTSAHSATALNTANRIVLRDGSGNFAAGTITANFIGTLTGNAATATLATLATTATTANRIRSVTVATLPASPSAGDLVRVIDGLSTNSCGVAGGVAHTVCQWNELSLNWEPAVSAGGSSTMQTAKDAGAIINNAVDLATCVRIGNDVIQRCLYADSSNVIREKAVDATGAALAVDKVVEGDVAKQIIVQSALGVPFMQWDNDTGNLTRLIQGTQAQGDIIYFDGTKWVRLPPGASGECLKTQGAAANPHWTTC